MGDNLERYLSKSLSFLLRHNTDAHPVGIDGKGFAALDDVVAAINSHSGTKGSVTANDVAEAVRQDEKGRFEISLRKDGPYIRALSGHSFPVEVEGEEFTPEGPLWFGTTMDAYARIDEHGLAQTAKLKVRLRETREEAEGVAAARKGDPLVVEVDAQALAADGYRFVKLANGEIVTDRFGRDRCTLPQATAPAP